MVKELMSVFDLPETYSSLFTKPDSCLFIGSAPGRLLGAVLSTIENPAQPSEYLIAVDPSPEVDRGDEEVMVAPAWSQVLGTEWEGISKLTTKADDAQAHTSLWDQRMYAGVQLNEAHSQLFTAHIQVSCLDALRAFLLRVWR
jgi:hypothetical protein